jgi:hypothetical protein
MNAFDRVMAAPASLAARYALLAEWRAAGNPQAELLEKQLLWSPRVQYERRAEIDALVKAHGRVWAGRVADLVVGFKFYRGLVGRVEVSGERFLHVGEELLALAPIQHVQVVKPLASIEAVAASPLLARLSTLGINRFGDEVGDRGAIALAHSPHVAHLVTLELWRNAIGRDGVEALAASPYLHDLRFLDLSGNPADTTPLSVQINDVMTPAEYMWELPHLAHSLAVRFGSRPWLEHPTEEPDDFYFTEDERALVRDFPEPA